MKESNLCIYTKEPHEDVELKSGDHIFLAAIGGIKKLPKTYVSHEANNHFSKLEKHFTRDSIISLVRQFEGPGKRGKLSIKNASKSNICVMSSQISSEDIRERYNLGYVKLGKPYTINQFIFKLDDDKSNMGTSINPEYIKDSDEPQKVLNSLLERARNSTNYILIKDDNLPNNIALFGELDDKWFLGINNDNILPIATEFINYLRNRKTVNVNDSKRYSTQVKANLKSKIDMEVTYRVIAKMVFNLLALEKGHEFILESRFDPIRNWIYSGEGESNFVNIISDNSVMKERFGSLYPERAHYIFITQIDNELVGLIGFYGATFSYEVKLTDLAPSKAFLPNLCGLICDWKNRVDYTLMEYILQLEK